MNGGCPACGLIAPIEVFLAIVQDKESLVIMGELPEVVSKTAIYYLGLFRPLSGKAVQPRTVRRLLGEIKELVDKGYVAWKRNPDRICPPSIWAEAMEDMLCRRDNNGLDLPIKSHGYLCSVAWKKADRADAVNERQRNENEKTGNTRPLRHVEEPEQVDFSDLTEAQLALIPQRVRNKHGV